ncbi:alpha/beta hydrolase fold domain-containing protein [Saccharibacter sp. 17.LH.SD]|uniref:alpha/beta hydrolase n=1 Tax=Saccharibacter sp. 17.LH.SD TaxID=2689393 RepID=UPI0013693A99|nr:alpha/beta hydrolase [Saccharibacter sp. 17.LH.SD]MXV44429.1 alpha/beta hydrolase fold domain-containing protein [Saccharibacter sp. 17.LH.SD]
MSHRGIRYIHDAEVSQESREFQGKLFEMGAKGLFSAIVSNNADSDFLKKIAGTDDITVPAAISDSLTDFCDLTTDHIQGRNVWCFTPKEHPSDKVIFYIHGGGYLLNISGPHWDFLENLCRETHAILVVPDYPLAPKAKCLEAYAVVEEAYDQTVRRYAHHDIVVMGDSAGGGMSLGLVQKLRDENKPLPKEVIVLSPWLDVTLNDLEIDAVEDRDHLLGSRGLVQAGLAYAGDLSPKNPKVSPKYGNFEKLPLISIFQGTNDIFIVDSRKLVARLEDENIPVNYFEFPEQCHIWAVFPSPEAEVAVSKMISLIKG